MIKKALLLYFISLTGIASAQLIDTNANESKPKEIKIPLNEEKSLKLNFLLQTWLRYTQTNPGTTVYGDAKSDIFDIGLRRARISLSGSPLDRVYVYTQFGMNNFNYISERQANFFFHDAITEYEAFDDKLFVGAGLTAWAGFSRFSTPSIGTLMGLDAPLFAQATNGATDQFLRKLSVYAKGNFGKINYRMAVAKPMAIQRSSLYQEINAYSTYSDKSPHNQYQAYVAYNFFDAEKLKNPYFKGTYLGEKKVFNIGAGFLYQQEAMHHLNSDNDTVYTDLVIFSADLFYDVPLKNEAALSLYFAYHHFNFGQGYLRNVGVMNPANGVNNMGTVNGPGNGVPMIGTGNNFYLQAGYMIGGDHKTKFMPYASALLAMYDRLDDEMLLFDLGVNMLLQKHKAKLTLGYQNRPIFQQLMNGDVITNQRKGMAVLQYQIAI